MLKRSFKGKQPFGDLKTFIIYCTRIRQEKFGKNYLGEAFLRDRCRLNQSSEKISLILQQIYQNPLFFICLICYNKDDKNFLSFGICEYLKLYKEGNYMKIEIIARNYRLTDRLEEVINKKMEKFSRYFHHLLRQQYGKKRSDFR